MRRRPADRRGAVTGQVDARVVAIDGFEQLELIDSGGYSRVFRARQSGFDRVVAIKVLNVDIESDAQRRSFERECRAMGALSEHPNIVTVLTAGFAGVADERRPCIVMEFYPGGTLAAWVQANGPLGIDRLLPIGILIAGALTTAHDRGVVHRDVKPQNVFLSEYGQPALGDFGISSFEGERTLTGAGGGLTVHYAPPEVLEGQSAGAASDVYSWAATLYFLATGERPFPQTGDQTMADVARRILIEPPPRLGADWPKSLADLLQTAMAKRPQDRPPSAATMGRELQRIQQESGLAVTELPVATKPPEWVQVPGSSSATDSVDVAIVARPGAKSVLLGSRSTRSWLLAAVTVIAAAGVAVTSAALDPSIDDADAPSDRRSSTTDGFFSAPTTPTGVTVELAGGAAFVRWRPAVDAVVYQVERLDAGEAGEVVEVSEPIAELAIEEGERPCVAVVAVGRDGRLSQPSAAVCAEG